MSVAHGLATAVASLAGPPPQLGMKETAREESCLDASATATPACACVPPPHHPATYRAETRWKGKTRCGWRGASSSFGQSSSGWSCARAPRR